MQDASSLQHLGTIEYKQAWDYQESLLGENLGIKKRNGRRELAQTNEEMEATKSHFLLCEHEPVFTLGKSGAMENLLVNNEYLKEKGISLKQTEVAISLFMVWGKS